jgi:hypothetical protein
MSELIAEQLLIREVILELRGLRVILDRDLAALYGVSTKAFNQAVKRNKARFPSDFLIQLTKVEKEQLVTDCDRFKTLKHSTVLPYAFTEHGALMAANILSSERANQMSIHVVRTFVKIREVMLEQSQLGQKVAEVESRLDTHDENIDALVRAMDYLLEQPETGSKKGKIGFHTD